MKSSRHAAVIACAAALAACGDPELAQIETIADACVQTTGGDAREDCACMANFIHAELDQDELDLLLSLLEEEDIDVAIRSARVMYPERVQAIENAGESAEDTCLD